MLYHGPVRVPAVARPGKAIVSVEFPEGATFRSIATDIEVELVKSTAKPRIAPGVGRPQALGTGAEMC